MGLELANMTYNEEYVMQGLSPMCLEPQRYGSMNKMNEKKKKTAELGAVTIQKNPLNEPFKFCIKNPPKPNKIMSRRERRILHREPKYHIHVESDDPCLVLAVSNVVISELEEHFRVRRPEVAFGDVSFVQKTIDEGAEPEKDA